MAATDATTLAVPAPRRSVRRRAGLVLRVLAGILLVFIVAIIAFAAYLVLHPLPTTNGTAALPGLSAPATVVRDKSGVPHITAGTLPDLLRAQGYVMAQDRLWQMDFYRRVAAGRLSEVLGATTLDTDRYLRTIGLHRAAEKEWATLPAEIKTLLQAYADGVSAFIATHGDSLPLEFTILGYKPEPWSPVDSIAFGKVMALDLGENMDTEIAMADLQAKLGPERAAALLPAYPDGKATIVRQSALPGNPAGRTALPPGSGVFGFGGGDELIGSNNWVIDGSLSADGKPLLANDPHLGVQNPSFWYINHLRLADGSFEVAGTSFAGAPGVVIGHNKDISWGVTNLSADVQDLFVETLDPGAHPGQYQYKGAWQPLTFITETIKVKDAADVTMTITSTVHGPLVDGVIPLIKKPTALQWTAGGPDGLISALIHLQTAHDWASVRAALSTWDAPGQNFVYADTKGNIGYQATGKIPIRKQGTGAAPVDGASGDYDWTGTIPFDEMPNAYNPPEHYIVTANNRVVGDQYPHLITTVWSPGYRAARIEELLKATPKLTVDDFKRIQLDTVSEYAKTVAPLYASLTVTDTTLQPLISRFNGWDGNLTVDSVPAAVYEVAFTHLMSSTFTAAVGDTIAGEYLENAAGEASLFMTGILKDANSPWWDDPLTSAHESRETALLNSLKAAASDLTTQLGDDPNAWGWGKVHQIYFAHALGGVPPLDSVFNFGPYGTPGDGTTVNTGYFSSSFGYYQVYHPSTRQITEVGNWDTMQVIIAPGQSGQPFSKHWGDLVQDWLNGRYRTLAVEPNSIQFASEGTLTLQP
jgi:penicillin amidase